MGNKGSDNQYQYPQFQLIPNQKQFIPYSSHQGYNFNQQNHQYNTIDYYSNLPYHNYPIIQIQHQNVKRSIDKPINKINNNQAYDKTYLNNANKSYTNTQMYQQIIPSHARVNGYQVAGRRYPNQYYNRNRLVSLPANAGNTYKNLNNNNKDSFIYQPQQNKPTPQIKITPYQPRQSKLCQSPQKIYYPYLKVNHPLVNNIQFNNPAISNTYNSNLKTNLSQINQNKTALEIEEDQKDFISKQINKYTNMIKSNLTIMKEKYDLMSTRNEEQLFLIMQEITKQTDNNFPNADKFIYLLVLKRNYENKIIQIRLKQQKLCRIINSISPQLSPIEVNSLVDKQSKDLVIFTQSLANWKSLLNSNYGGSEFNKLVQQGRNDPEIMLNYNKITTQINKNQINLYNSHHIPHNYSSRIMYYANDQFQSRQYSLIKSNITARFGRQDQHLNNISNKPNNNNIFNVHNDQRMSISKINQQLLPLTRSKTKSKNQSQIFNKMDKQTNMKSSILLTNLLQSKVKPPQRIQPFAPILPTSGHFRR